MRYCGLCSRSRRIPVILFHHLCHSPSHLQDYFTDVSASQRQDGRINMADARKRFSFGLLRGSGICPWMSATMSSADSCMPSRLQPIIRLLCHIPTAKKPSMQYARLLQLPRNAHNAPCGPICFATIWIFPSSLLNVYQPWHLPPSPRPSISSRPSNLFSTFVLSHRFCFSMLTNYIYNLTYLQKNMTSSTKLQVHNIFYCCKRKTEPRPQLTCINFFGVLYTSFLRYASRHTDRHTDVLIPIICTHFLGGGVTTSSHFTWQLLLTVNCENVHAFTSLLHAW